MSGSVVILPFGSRFRKVLVQGELSRDPCSYADYLDSFPGLPFSLLLSFFFREGVLLDNDGAVVPVGITVEPAKEGRGGSEP